MSKSWRLQFFITLGSLLQRIYNYQVRPQSLKMDSDYSDYNDQGNSSRPTTNGTYTLDNCVTSSDKRMRSLSCAQPKANKDKKFTIAMDP